MDTPDILLLNGLTLGRRMKAARAARDLRQGDVAYLATQELHRRGFTHLKINANDVGWLERDVSINKRKQACILSVLFLEDSGPHGGHR